MDDLKKASRLKGLKPNFAHPVLRAVCRRAMTKMEGLSDCQAIKAEEELTIAASKINVYSRKESFACSRAPVSFPTPHPLPCLSWTLQDGGWVKDVEDSAVDRGKSRPSTWFRCLSTLGWCRRPAVRADCYGFMLPAGAAGTA